MSRLVQKLIKLETLLYKTGCFFINLGAVDLIPIHPITQQSTLDDCAKIALDIGKELTLSHSGLSVFYFGHADGDLKVV